ncbi:hypothetical protein B0O80DRAFT_238029 [Mortierella sp. GBAus27b]|nr:hypothetical protein B0O80DRAFT_238029 [Mortierella sp. GBAus27b]
MTTPHYNFAPPGGSPSAPTTQPPIRHCSPTTFPHPYSKTISLLSRSSPPRPKSLTTMDLPAAVPSCSWHPLTPARPSSKCDTYPTTIFLMVTTMTRNWQWPRKEFAKQNIAPHSTTTYNLTRIKPEANPNQTMSQRGAPSASGSSRCPSHAPSNARDTSSSSARNVLGSGHAASMEC